MNKIAFDNGFNSQLVKNATFVGEPGIPMLSKMNNIDIPSNLVPFTKLRTSKTKKGYIHFYEHDRYFSSFLNNPSKYLEGLKNYDGVITPDPTMFVDESKCLLETATYINRAYGFFLQENGIPVIPNIRWTNEKSFDYCFLGAPKHYVVSISTHGCCRSKKQKEDFRNGLLKMLEVLEPTDVLVHGYMPKEIFESIPYEVNFHRFPSEFEQTHSNKENC